MRDPLQTTEELSWRTSVLRAVLTATSLVLVIAVGVTLVGRSSKGAVEPVALVAAALVVPALRYAPRLSMTARAGGVIAVLICLLVFLLARIGFVPGVSLGFAIAAVLGMIYVGRSFAFLLILLAGLAFVVIGLLVTHGQLSLNPGDLDLTRMRNWARVAGTTVLLAGLLALMVDFVIRRVEAQARDLRVAFDQLGALHGRLEAAKENERRFLANELHDDLGQTLTVLKFRLQGTAGAAAAETVGLVDEVIGRIRMLSVGLRPPLLDEVGLVPALRAYLESQAAATRVSMELTTEPGEGDFDRLSSDLEIACFRVVQESITNALRHAAAGRIHVRVIRRPSSIEIAIHDDGCGFDAVSMLPRAAGDGHLGVVGMRERVRGRGGTFALDSRPGGGTRVTVRLPTSP